MHFAGDQLAGEGILDLALDGPLERPGAEDRVVANADHMLPGIGREHEFDVPFGEALAQDAELDLDNLLQVLDREAVEDDGFVDAIQELGPEELAQFVHHRELHEVELGAGIGALVLEDALRAEVRGHDDDGVLEVDDPALTVGEAAVIQDLQQDVEDVRMRLFDFVEQQDGVGATPDLLGQLPALLVADVAGRRADEARDVVLLLILGHVDADQGAFVVEEAAGQGAAEFGFADAGGAEEDEAADGTVGVLEAAAGAQDGLGDGGDGVVLTDDALVKLAFEVEELVHFAFEQARDRHAGPAADDVGDVVFGDFFFQ